MRLGPLIMEVRKKGLETVLEIQARVNIARGSRPAVDLINEEELACINRLMDAGTRPQGWEGDESVGNELIEEARPGGISLPMLNFAESE